MSFRWHKTNKTWVHHSVLSQTSHSAAVVIANWNHIDGCVMSDKTFALIELFLGWPSGSFFCSMSVLSSAEGMHGLPSRSQIWLASIQQSCWQKTWPVCRNTSSKFHGCGDILAMSPFFLPFRTYIWAAKNPFYTATGTIFDTCREPWNGIAYTLCWQSFCMS